jgi:ankyrin repeat protein
MEGTMKLQKIIDGLGLTVVTKMIDKEAEGVFVSDMLSDAMSNAQPGNLWVTSQTHKNVVSAANLLDMAAVVISQGENIPQDTMELANRFKVVILSSPLATSKLSKMLNELGLHLVQEFICREEGEEGPGAGEGKSKCRAAYAHIFDAIENDDVDAAIKFIDEGTSVEITDDTGATPLHWAAHQDLLELMQFLESKGANIYAHDDDGWTPLHWAKSKKVIEFLLEHGADVNTRDQYGQTPLHILAMDTTPDVIEFLLSKGASLTAKEAFGKLPIHFAATKDNAEVVSFLISKGAPVNAKEEYGKTPMHFAVLKGHKEVIDVLLKHKADCSIKDNDGKTPLDYAKERENKSLIDFLKKKGCI